MKLLEGEVILMTLPSGFVLTTRRVHVATNDANQMAEAFLEDVSQVAGVRTRPSSARVWAWLFGLAGAIGFIYNQAEAFRFETPALKNSYQADSLAWLGICGVIAAICALVYFFGGSTSLQVRTGGGGMLYVYGAFDLPAAVDRIMQAKAARMLAVAQAGRAAAAAECAAAQ